MVEMWSDKLPPKNKKPDLIVRFISACALMPIFLWLTYNAGVIFYSVLTFIFIIALREWFKLSTHTTFHPSFTLSSKQGWGIFIAGLVYLSIAMGCFLNLCTKNILLETANGIPFIDNRPTLFIIWLYTIVWATDIGAYFTGRLLKGPKLCPKISPNKTWAGFFGGIIVAIGVGQLTLSFFNLSFASLVSSSVIILILSLSAHIGDLIESAAKRYFNVKDAGRLIPGHGGILDRLDSLFFVAIIASALIYMNVISHHIF